MPRIKYVTKHFRNASLYVIEQANDIIGEYAAQGFDLTLRQLYYQFVSRDLLPNTQRDYSRLGSIINDARLAGLVDWNAIEDRTRNLAALSHWEHPGEILDACAHQFRYDKWSDQPYRAEIWIEKEALAGVFAGVCRKLDVPYFSCRGYVSQSEMWRAGMRLKSYEEDGQRTTIFHFGDHDPSGIDMTRDIADRLRMFGAHTEVKRVALNMEQVREHEPPPNPAKLTDSRSGDYINRFGRESWELDALEPAILTGLVELEVDAILDSDRWDIREEQEQQAQDRLAELALELAE
jgi:hypothetical protein